MTWQYPLDPALSADDVERIRAELLASTTVAIPHDDGVLSGKPGLTIDVRDIAANGVRRPMVSRQSDDDDRWTVGADGLLVPATPATVRYVPETGAPSGWLDGVPVPDTVRDAQSRSRVTVSRKRRRSFVVPPSGRRSFARTVGWHHAESCELESIAQRAGQCECWHVPAWNLAAHVEVQHDGTFCDVVRYVPARGLTDRRLQALASAYVRTCTDDDGADVERLARPIDWPVNVVNVPALDVDRSLTAGDIVESGVTVRCGCASRWGRTAPSPACTWCDGTGVRPYLLAPVTIDGDDVRSGARIVECSVTHHVLAGIDDGADWLAARSRGSNVRRDDIVPRYALPRIDDTVRAVWPVVIDRRWTDLRGRKRHTVHRGHVIAGTVHVLAPAIDGAGRPGWHCGCHRFVRCDVLARWARWRGLRSTARVQTGKRSERKARSAALDRAGTVALAIGEALATLPVGASLRTNGAVLERPSAGRYVVTIGAETIGARTPASAANHARTVLRRAAH